MKYIISNTHEVINSGKVNSWKQWQELIRDDSGGKKHQYSAIASLTPCWNCTLCLDMKE